uniref:Conotoxin CaHr91 n=1 Tax=Conus capitaneus TaxID=89439 RepID=O16H_CONCE|nr:RecName: Full=Conotoxin CaHr91; Flags: Precursor [Conus capitaneus]AAZ83770.1 CaHr91P [Conus capitaneus]
MKLTCALIITVLFLSITADDSRGKQGYRALKSIAGMLNSKTVRECREQSQGCTNTSPPCCSGLRCSGQSQGGVCISN